MKLEGFVRPSLFLAIFLSILALVGLFCLCLVLSYLYPSIGNSFVLLTLLAPGAGIFYWRKAGRAEKILLQIIPYESREQQEKSRIIITAHRDELIQFQKSPLPVKIKI